MFLIRKRRIMAVGYSITVLFSVIVSASSESAASSEGFLKPQKLCDGEPCELSYAGHVVPGSVKPEEEVPKSKYTDQSQLEYVGLYSLVTAENANGMIVEGDKIVKSEKMKKKMPEVKSFDILNRYLVKIYRDLNEGSCGLACYRLQKQVIGSSEWFYLGVDLQPIVTNEWQIKAVEQLPNPGQYQEWFRLERLTADRFGATPVKITAPVGGNITMLHLTDPSGIVGQAMMVPDAPLKTNNKFYIVEHNKFAEMDKMNGYDTFWFINKVEGKCFNPFGANDQEDAGCTMLFDNNTRLKPVMLDGGSKFQLITESATYEQLAQERGYVDNKLRTTLSSGGDPGDLLVGFADQPVADYHLKDFCLGWTLIQTNDKLLWNKYNHLLSIKGDGNDDYVRWQVARIRHDTADVLISS